MNAYTHLFTPDDPAENNRCDNWPECDNEFESLLGDRWLCADCFNRAWSAEVLEREAAAHPTCATCGEQYGGGGSGLCPSCWAGQQPD